MSARRGTGIRSTFTMTVVSQATTVSGLGGIGKTGLAIEYVKTYSTHYQGNILWINADSADEVRKCYRSLAQRLQISLVDRSGETRDITQVKEDIYARFVGCECLFVFDNCPDPVFVAKECIPDTFLPSFCTLPKFLLTSRNQEWDRDIGVLLLDEMKPEEAETLIMKRLCLQESNEDIRLLAQLLQYFPLAIHQATAYIYDQQRNHDNYTIDSYMNDFKSKSAMLLDTPILGIDNKYKKTTFTTWQISFEEIRNVPTAANILHMMAYMAPDNVNREIFCCLFPRDGDVANSVKLICKYSLLKGEQKQAVLSIHRLVQEVIRLQLESKQESEAVLEMCLKLLTNTNLSETNHPFLIWGRSAKFGSLIEQFYESSTAAMERKLTPLHILSQGGDCEGVYHILNYFRLKGRRDEKDRLDCYGRTPLILACEQGHVQVVKILLENQARTDIMAQSVRQRKTFAPKNAGRTAMLAAVRSRSLETVQLLKNSHWDPSKESGISPAELAASYGEMEMCKELSGNISVYLCAMISSKGKEMNDVMTSVRREITVSPKERRSEIMKYPVRGSTLVAHAIINDYPEDFVWFLIEEGGGIAEAEKVTQTPLVCSVFTGRLDLVKFLIKNGSNVNVIHKGLTLLHIAALRGKGPVVKFLLEENFDIEIRSSDNLTPLHYAATHGRVEAVEILIAAGSDCSVSNIFNQSPLHCAASYNHYSIVEMILKGIPEGKKEDVCTQIASQPCDCTIVHLAAAYDNVEFLSYLLEELCMDGDVDNGHGITPLHFACIFGSWNAVNYLCRKKSVNLQRTIKPSALLQIAYDKMIESETSWSIYEKLLLKWLYCYSRVIDLFVVVTASELGNAFYPDCPLRDAKPGWFLKKLLSFHQVRSSVSNVQSKVAEFKRRRARNKTGR
ncbi:ankyrin-1-like isoform X2 [Bradysia coprophila]|uniref:ankyrin-1-like isoform X2 n=1 Tax=Bradysia coprophila TaxID=38358 RepID=UPI00187D958F|nr:ankyrin-1-like isoform X2 [Bradysia coprophila]